MWELLALIHSATLWHGALEHVPSPACVADLLSTVRHLLGLLDLGCWLQSARPCLLGVFNGPSVSQPASNAQAAGMTKTGILGYTSLVVHLWLVARRNVASGCAIICSCSCGWSVTGRHRRRPTLSCIAIAFKHVFRIASVADDTYLVLGTWSHCAVCVHSRASGMETRYAMEKEQVSLESIQSACLLLGSMPPA